MIDPTRPIAELVANLKAGTFSVVQLVQACLDRIEATESYHTILELNSDALERAKAVDRAIKQGSTNHRLLGIPFIAKDNFLAHITHSTAGSNILKSFQAPYQSTAIEKLEAEGAILIAKANLDAFGHGSSTENSDFGPTKNPWNPQYVPGGSSGGPAAAVAMGQCSFALATDTGGSIRQPASFTGVVGLKPTYGLVSRSGVVAMASSFDVIGPLTRTVEDAALILDVIAGQDPLDATSIERDEDSYSLLTPRSSLLGLKIGLIKEYMGEGIDAEVKSGILTAADQLKAAGAEVGEISLPATELALACYYILVPAEISSNLARYDGIKYGHSAAEASNLAETYELSRDQGFGAEAKRRILIGTYVLSSGYYDAYYKKAQAVRTLIIEQFNAAFDKYDFLIGPTAPTLPFKLGQKTHDPLAMYLGDVMTVAISLVGAPAIVIPIGKSQGLPIGLQLIGPQRSEGRLLAAAAAAEELVGHIGSPKL